jgi:hypothetical protein
MEQESMFIGLLFSAMVVIIGVIIAFGTVFYVLSKFA